MPFHPDAPGFLLPTLGELGERLPDTTGRNGVQDTNGLLLAILEQLRDVNPRDSFGIRRTATQGQQNYAIGEIVATGALTNFRVVVGTTYRLSFFDWPQELTTFTVRLDSPDSNEINVLAGANIIERDTPILQIFVTTSPAAGAGGVHPRGAIRYTTGNLRINRIRPSEASPGYNVVGGYPCLPGGAINASTIDLSTITVNRPRCAVARHILTAAGTNNMFTNIPANTPFRIFNVLAAELQSTAGNITQTTVDIGTIHQTMLWDTPIGDLLQQVWSTDWLFHTETTLPAYIFDVVTLAPAGQRVQLYSKIEMLPILPV